MKKLWSLSFISLVVVAPLLAACGSSSSDSDKPVGSPAEALSKLSDDDKAKFQNWQSSLVKSCEVSQIFGDKAGTSLIDQELFKAKTKGLSLLQNKSEALLVGSGLGSSGTTDDKYEAESTFNGAGYKIKARSVLSGTTCDIYLYDQKVKTLTVYASIPVYAQFLAKPQVSDAARPAFQVLPDTASEGAALQAAALTAELHHSVSPTEKAHEFLSSYLGVTKDLSEKLFSLQSSESIYNDAYKIEAPFGSAWTGGGDLVLADRLALNQLAQFESTLELSWIIPDGDAGNLKFQVNLKSTPQSDHKSVKVLVTSITPLGVFAPLVSEGLSCLNERAQRYTKAFPMTGQELRPSVDEVFSGCSVLSRDLKSTAETEILPRILDSLLAGRVAGNVVYNGWDQVVQEIVWAEAKAAGNFEKALATPKSPVLLKVVEASAQARQDLGHLPKMSGALPEASYELAVNWALKTANLNSGDVTNTLQALENSVDPFLESTRRALSEATNSLGRNTETINFAAGLNQSYKDSYRDLLSIAKKIGYSDFESTYFNQALQLRLDANTLADLQSKIEKVQLSYNKFPQLSSPAGSQAMNLVFSLIKAGAAQDSDVESLLSGVAKVLPELADPVTALLSSVNAGNYSQNRDKFDFLAKVDAAYKKSYLSLVQKASAGDEIFKNWIKDYKDSVLSNKVERAELDNNAATVDAAGAFVTADQARHAQAANNEWTYDSAKKSLLNKALEQKWNQNDFSDVTQISALAEFNSFCKDYRSVASRVDCLGLRKVGKSKEELEYPAYGNRYGAYSSDLVPVIRNILAAANGNSFFADDLVSSVIGTSSPLWPKCDNASFSSKERALLSTVKQWISQDQLGRWDTESKVRDLLRSDCSG